MEIIMNENKSNSKSYIMLISSMVIVGTIGAFRKYIPLSSALLAFVRGVLGAVFLCTFVLLKRGKITFHISRKQLVLLILNGIFLGINWILLFEAFNYTTVATATLCYYMQPTIVLLISPIILKEKLLPKKLICAIVAILGMVLVSGVLRGASETALNIQGILLALGAAVFYAIIVILNKIIGSADSYEKTIVQLSSAAIILIPYLLITEDFSGMQLSPTIIALLLIVGVVHTGIAYALYFGSMNVLKAQTISTCSYIDPVVALLVSAVFLQEPMTVSSIMGAVLILGSAVISEINMGATN